MKKEKRKGFTLIELLAVIVVLAIVMVLAVPIVLGQMNNAKKKSFQIYGERVLSSVMNAYESDSLLGNTSPKQYSGLPCYDLSDLKLETTGNYAGFVTVNHSDVGNTTIYKIYLSDSTYGYNGETSEDVYNFPEKIHTSNEDITAINNIVGKSGSSQCVERP